MQTASRSWKSKSVFSPFKPPEGAETCWHFMYFIFKNIYLFICGSAGSWLLLVGFSSLQRVGVAFSLQCSVFSQRQLLLLWSMSSRRMDFSSCGTWASLPRGMWNLPIPGIEPMLPALAGRFLSAGPAENPLSPFNLYNSPVEDILSFWFSRWGTWGIESSLPKVSELAHDRAGIQTAWHRAHVVNPTCMTHLMQPSP